MHSFRFLECHQASICLATENSSVFFILIKKSKIVRGSIIVERFLQSRLQYPKNAPVLVTWHWEAISTFHFGSDLFRLSPSNNVAKELNLNLLLDRLATVRLAALSSSFDNPDRTKGQFFENVIKHKKLI